MTPDAQQQERAGRERRDKHGRDVIRALRRKVRNLKAEMLVHDTGRGKDRVWFWGEIKPLRADVARLTAELAERTGERDRMRRLRQEDIEVCARQALALEGYSWTVVNMGIALEEVAAERDQARADLAASRDVLADIRAQVHTQEHGGYAADATPADQCDRWVCGIVNRALAPRPSGRAAGEDGR